MAEIGVPQLVKDKLSIGETVVGKYATRYGDYIATSKRLMLFQSQSKFTSINYPEVSINLVKYGAGWTVFRFFCILIGLLSIVVGILGSIGLTIDTGDSVTHFDAPFGYALLFWFMGLFIIFIVLIMRYAYYQISAPGIDKKDTKKWRIERVRWGGGTADTFAAALQKAARMEKKENAL